MKTSLLCPGPAAPRVRRSTPRSPGETRLPDDVVFALSLNELQALPQSADGLHAPQEEVGWVMVLHIGGPGYTTLRRPVGKTWEDVRRIGVTAWDAG